MRTLKACQAYWDTQAVRLRKQRRVLVSVNYTTPLSLLNFVQFVVVELFYLPHALWSAIRFSSRDDSVIECSAQSLRGSLLESGVLYSILDNGCSFVWCVILHALGNKFVRELDETQKKRFSFLNIVFTGNLTKTVFIAFVDFFSKSHFLKV